VNHQKISMQSIISLLQSPQRRRSLSSSFSLTYLEVKHARLRSVLELGLPAALLKEGVDLWHHRNRQHMHSGMP
jgi:hypothetical protein